MITKAEMDSDVSEDKAVFVQTYISIASPGKSLLSVAKKKEGLDGGSGE